MQCGKEVLAAARSLKHVSERFCFRLLSSECMRTAHANAAIRSFNDDLLRYALYEEALWYNFFSMARETRISWGNVVVSRMDDGRFNRIMWCTSRDISERWADEIIDFDAESVRDCLC